MTLGAIANELLESGLCEHGERNEFRHAYECEICLPKALARAHAEGLREGLLVGARLAHEWGAFGVGSKLYSLIPAAPLPAGEEGK